MTCDVYSVKRKGEKTVPCGMLSTPVMGWCANCRGSILGSPVGMKRNLRNPLDGHGSEEVWLLVCKLLQTEITQKVFQWTNSFQTQTRVDDVADRAGCTVQNSPEQMSSGPVAFQALIFFSCLLT